jgi:uncharacterized repeat protein (TIGR03803 family)
MQRCTTLSAVALTLAWIAPAAAESTLTVLHYVTTQTGGGPEYPPIIGPNGVLYGTTYGTDGGALYSINPDGSNFTILSNFPGGSGGAGTFSGLSLGNGGLLYGTTLGGGTSGQGIVYQFDPVTQVEVVLHAFNFADGSVPLATPVLDGAGNLYGTTSAGGANQLGTIYKIALSTGAFTKLADLDRKTGGMPYAPLVIGTNGWLYGTTTVAGPSGGGTIFRISPTTGKIERLYGFSGLDGKNAFTSLTPGKRGIIYGVTSFGGLVNRGVLFAFSLRDRQLTVLHQFSGNDGSYPQGALALDSGGNLVGTTFAGGSHDSGVIFRYVHDKGTYQVLQNLVLSKASLPVAGLTYAGGKTFYGGTLHGGPGEFATGAIIAFFEP